MDCESYFPCTSINPTSGHIPSWCYRWEKSCCWAVFVLSWISSLVYEYIISKWSIVIYIATYIKYDIYLLKKEFISKGHYIDGLCLRGARVQLPFEIRHFQSTLSHEPPPNSQNWWLCPMYSKNFRSQIFIDKDLHQQSHYCKIWDKK